MQEKAIQRLENQLVGWEHQINELEAELDRIGPRTRSRYFRDVQELKERRDAAKNRLSQLRLKQAESWEEEDLQAGIIRVFDDIGCRVNRLVSKVSRTH
ncbi:hypothetical protein [Thiohalomonas denitrificans]|uniref:hypothetical protein n=1 Tax=Thiohalomonas denitrificans TaxID=415747 RepID=UPI0026F25671|nr:hypothetical protein [Thiohalomonas denitrificans]